MKLMRYSVAIVLVLSSFLALADPIEDQLDAAIKAYKAGDLRGAMNELKFAQADLQSKIDEKSKVIMPDPLEGWTADETEATSMGGGMMMGMGGGTQLSRTYRKIDNNQTVEIQIIADSPMIQMMAMMLNNPMMMQSDPSTKTFRHGSMRGMMKHEPGSRDYEASFMLGGRILLQVIGNNLEDDSAVKAYLDVMDMKKVEQTFAQ
jgi:hypothetical protein